MIEFVVVSWIIGGFIVACGLGIYLIVAGATEAVRTVRLARSGSLDGGRDPVVEVPDLVDQLAPVESGSWHGGDGFRNRAA